MKTSKSGSRGHFKIFSDSGPDEAPKGAPKKVKTGKRRSLAPLQPSVVGENVLAGHGRQQSLKDILDDTVSKLTENAKTHRSGEDQFVFSNGDGSASEDLPAEPSVPPNDHNISADNLVDDALSLMKATDEVGETYWKEIAEERRIALEETLSENDRLYDELEKLKSEVENSKEYMRELESYKMLYLGMCERKDSIVCENEGSAES